MRRLTKAEKMRLLEITAVSSMGTPRWRDFVTLRTLDLVEIDDDDSNALSSLYGVSFRHVRATQKGKDIAETIARDVPLWHATACAHARAGRRCFCWACTTAHRMRPIAA